MTDDNDPTGMRRLLAGIKETGPMPEDLSQRIRASLAQEQADRADRAEQPDGADNEFWTEMESDPRRPRRRTSTAGRWVLVAAAACVVVVGAGSIWAMRGGGDTATESAASAGAAAEEDAGGQKQAESSGTGDDATSIPAFAVTDSGNDYSQESVASEAAAIERDPRTVPQLENLGVVGAMATAAGAKDCLARLGEPALQPVVIDVAHFEGTPGLLLIAESQPEGSPKAWAITTGCKEIWPGPITLATD